MLTITLLAAPAPVIFPPMKAPTKAASPTLLTPSKTPVSLPRYIFSAITFITSVIPSEPPSIPASFIIPPTTSLTLLSINLLLFPVNDLNIPLAIPRVTVSKTPSAAPLVPA